MVLRRKKKNAKSLQLLITASHDSHWTGAAMAPRPPEGSIDAHCRCYLMCCDLYSKEYQLNMSTSVIVTIVASWSPCSSWNVEEALLNLFQASMARASMMQLANNAGKVDVQGHEVGLNAKTLGLVATPSPAPGLSPRTHLGSSIICVNINFILNVYNQALTTHHWWLGEKLMEHRFVWMLLMSRFPSEMLLASRLEIFFEVNRFSVHAGGNRRWFKLANFEHFATFSFFLFISRRCGCCRAAFLFHVTLAFNMKKIFRHYDHP